MRLSKWIGSVGALTLGASLLMGGCASDPDAPITIKDVRGKTPELATITDSEGQFKNREARVLNSYLRGIRTDLSRALLFDQNTRLTEISLP
jgi:hypothetical protein